MAVGDSGYQQAQPGAGGMAAERRERGVSFEALAGAFAVHGLEVIEAPHAVETGVIGKPGPSHHLTEGHPLLGDVESEAHVPIMAAHRHDRASD